MFLNLDILLLEIICRIVIQLVSVLNQRGQGNQRNRLCDNLGQVTQEQPDLDTGKIVGEILLVGSLCFNWILPQFENLEEPRVQ